MNDLKDFTRNIIYDETVKGFICTDKFYNELKDYITNLQQEIQKKDAYIKYLEEYNPKYYKGKKFYGDSREELQSRIDEAIKYIEHSNYDIIGRVCSFTKLLNILKGDSDER